MPQAKAPTYLRFYTHQNTETAIRGKKSRSINSHSLKFHILSTNQIQIFHPSRTVKMFALRRNVSSTLSRSFSTSARNNSFAKLTLIGRLADKPEITATSQGQEIMKYAVGTSTGRGENQKTSWFRVVSFLPEGPQRDFISNLEKG